MKKLSLILGILLFSASVYYLARPENTSFPLVGRKSHNKARGLFLGARTNAPVAKSQTTPHAGCSKLTTQLDILDFTRPSSEWRESIELSDLDLCEEADFQDKISEIRTFCFDQFSDEECLRSAVFLRALLRTKNLKDANDQEQLADLILREFANLEPDFKQLEHYAEKLLNLDASNPAYQKLWAASSIITALNTSSLSSEHRETIQSRTDDSVWEDPEMEGLGLALETGLDPKNVESFTRDLLANSSNPKMHEILGWSLWRQSKYSEAIAELRKAVELNPEDQFLQIQLKRITQEDVSEDAYQARISLGFNIEDLYQ